MICNRFFLVMLVKLVIACEWFKKGFSYGFAIGFRLLLNPKLWIKQAKQSSFRKRKLERVCATNTEFIFKKIELFLYFRQLVSFLILVLLKF